MSPDFVALNSTSWAQALGLLPVPLRESEAKRLVFLNGNRGNFCLDLTPSAADEQGRNIAWSADVGHYLRLTGTDQLEIQRWDRAEWRVTSLAAVRSDPERFHAQLEAEQPRRDLAIVPHFISVFRRIRTALRGMSGHDALQAYLVLVAAAEEGVDRRQVNASRWGLKASAIDVAEQVSPDEWALFVERLTTPRTHDGLTPIPDLVLRHASGLLFEDAHYDVVAQDSNQLGLWPQLPKASIPTQKIPESVGVHFTPAAIVRALTEEALRNTSKTEHVRVFDPACGSGEFLREAHRQLRLAKFAGGIDLLGWDITPSAVSMARFVLARETRSDHSTRIDIQQEDSLAKTWPTADLILMNPPFRAWNDLGSSRTAVSNVLGGLLRQKPDMASAFLKRAVDSLSAVGCLGTVLPASLIDGRTYSYLRGFVADALTPTLIARLGSQQLFQGAMVDASLLVASRVPKVEPARVWADHRPQSAARALRAFRRTRQVTDPLLPQEDANFSVYPQSLTSSESSWRPQPYTASKRIEQLAHFRTAGDLFRIQQGVLTGLNRVFILSASQLDALPTREHSYFRPALVNESIVGGALERVAHVFYPFDQEGEPRISSEDALGRAVKNYFRDFLVPNESELKARRSLRSRKWWELVEPRLTWQPKQVPRIVSTYFGAAGSFAYDDAGAYVVVQGYAWQPKGRGFTHTVGFGYVALLASSLVDDLLAGVSDRMSGGQWNLSARFVSRMPLPDLAEADLGLVRDLAEAGRKLSRAIAVSRDHLDELARSAYGLKD